MTRSNSISISPESAAGWHGSRRGGIRCHQAMASGLLCLVQGSLRPANEFPGGLRTRRAPAAHGDLDLAIADGKGRGSDRRADALAEEAGSVDVGLRKQEKELLPARLPFRSVTPPADDVLGAEGCPDSQRELLEHCVARFAAVGVIDLLEGVD